MHFFLHEGDKPNEVIERSIVWLQDQPTAELPDGWICPHHHVWRPILLAQEHIRLNHSDCFGCTLDLHIVNYVVLRIEADAAERKAQE